MSVVEADLDNDGGLSEEAYLDALVQRAPPVGFRYLFNHSDISALIAAWLNMHLKQAKVKTDVCHSSIRAS